MKSSAPRRKNGGKTETSTNEGTGDPSDRLQRISLAAYYRAQARGFAPGQAMDDWLTAEAEVDRGAAA